MDLPINIAFCLQPTYPGKLLTTIRFVTQDHTEIELVDQSILQGAPYIATQICAHPTNNRGKIFVSKDDGSTTFVSDDDIIDDTEFSTQLTQPYAVSGYLLFADGARYRIESGVVKWIRDRNGNRIDFSYEGSLSTGFRLLTVTDSAGHRITINYDTAWADVISYKGFSGAERQIKVWYARLEGALRPRESIQTISQLFPQSHPLLDYTNNPVVVSKVELPGNQQNERAHRFYYNSYGELARVILPTGGGYDYDWIGDPPESQGMNPSLIIQRRVSRRVTYTSLAPDTDPIDPPAGSIAGKMVYSVEHGGAQWRAVTVESRSATTLLAQSKHYFFDADIFSPCTPVEYNRWYQGREYKVEEYSVVSGALGPVQRRVEHAWHPITSGGGGCVSGPVFNPHITATTTTRTDVSPNLVSKVEFEYDTYNQVVEKKEYDFGAGAPGPLIRRTHTSYLTTNGNQGNVNYATDNNIHIRNLPVQKIIYDASGNVRARTDYIYDDYGSYALVDRPGIVQHDDGFHAGYGARGNLTEVILRNPGGSPSEVHLKNQYDVAGNPVKAVDGRGFATDFDFTDRFDSTPDDEAQSNAGPPELGGGLSYAFPTKVTNALGHTTYTQYDYYLGKPVNVEDANGVVSSVAYDDVLDRPTQSVQARYRAGVGAPNERKQTTFTYDDANRTVTTTSDLAMFNDNVLTNKSYFDGLGRMWRGAAREGDTWTITDTQHDSFDRVSQVSNPYRAVDPDSASPPSDMWTRTVYDALGRVVDVETPDGAHVTTLFSGNRTTVFDQSGKESASETDALGRLIKVIEDPRGLNYVTSYSYDELDNLLRVAQGPQTRIFVYNSLSKLTSATNPESGTISYVYDQSGNLMEKTDAREVKTTMTYDALNRITSKVYAGTTPEGRAAADATPRVDYFYDKYSGLQSGAPDWSGTPSKGRLVGVTYNGGSEGTYYKYDPVGRIVINHQRQGTANYATAYFYNLEDAVTREDRGSPARRRTQMFYDEAGSLSIMQTGPYSFSGIEYTKLVSEISYTPFGAVQSEKYGNGLIHSMGYNNRKQPTEIRLGRPDNLESIFRINNIFGTADNVNSQDQEIALAQNNGDIARVKYFISGTLQYTQTFKYDPADRLSHAVEHKNGIYNDMSRAWYQTFDYDPHGNRGIDVDNTSDNMDVSNGALKLSEFSRENNRITRAGFAYDVNGNLTDELERKYFYDAENRLYRVTVAGVVTSQNFYDGLGHRVRRVVVGVATRFEYGKNGELITEWNDVDSGKVALRDYFYKGGELLATTKTGATDQYEYATADHLGSPRAWTGPDGATIPGGLHDYAPFGGELFAGYGVRTTDQGYPSSAQQDGKRKQFASKERDAEVNLDYFLARYYSSVQGRFLSHDPGNAGAKPEDPQSWNGYSYTLNNPLAYTDPNGKCPTCPAEEYIDLANAAYSTERGGRVGRWSAIEVFENNSTGYRGVLFEGVYNGNTEYIYATAGTDDIHDVFQDVGQLKGISTQYRDTVKIADDLAKKYEGVSFTGHSLGGGLAAANALAVEGKAVTFNAAGLSLFTKSNLGLGGKNADISAYIVKGELVDRLQPIKADGKRIYMGNGVSKSQALGAHKMDYVIKTFREYQYMNSAQGRFDQQLKLQTEIQWNRARNMPNAPFPRF